MSDLVAGLVRATDKAQRTVKWSEYVEAMQEIKRLRKALKRISRLVSPTLEGTRIARKALEVPGA